MSAFSTPRLGLPFLAAGQAQKHVTHNDALMALDDIVHLSAKAMVSALPAEAEAGDRVLLLAAAGGGAVGDIAEKEEGGGWRFVPPRPGWVAFLEQDGALKVWSEGAWRPVKSQLADSLGINTQAALPARLAVRSSAALFHAAAEESGDCRVAVSRIAVENTASVLFQTGFSGRAEIGLTGSAAFELKLSEDGAAWTSSLMATPLELDLRTADRTRLHFTSEGHLITSLTGDISNIAAAFSVRPTFQMNNTSAGSGILFSRWVGSSGGPNGIVFAKSRGGAIGTHAATAANDALGGMHFEGSDGTAFLRAASINAAVDGTVSSGVVPGRLSFSTTPAGGILTERLRLTGAGDLGLGVTAPHARLTVAGAVSPAVDNAHSLGSASYRWASVYAAGGVIQASDERLKTDVCDCPLGLDFVLTLRPKLFRWREGGRLVEERAEPAPALGAGEAGEPAQIRAVATTREGSRYHAGLMAQEVRAALEAAGVDCGIWLQDDPADPDSRQSLRYDQLIAPMVQAIRELSARVDRIEAASRG
ncbi:endosialidase-like protein [Bosea sp. AK1]|uniref:DUF2793 domain-containing protein n=1 Tax=Bosea sp. AK1 TaxID=2587160 RepID=UPI0011504013|nr:DUF2793 domain-containing protein [Bosea sp. AK1]TQI75645.1 endosialidase-like protein [Bosea sp. AK1]